MILSSLYCLYLKTKIIGIKQMSSASHNLTKIVINPLTDFTDPKITSLRF